MLLQCKTLTVPKILCKSLALFLVVILFWHSWLVGCLLKEHCCLRLRKDKPAASKIYCNKSQVVLNGNDIFCKIVISNQKLQYVTDFSILL